jgi:hypothetical protein
MNMTVPTPAGAGAAQVTPAAGPELAAADMSGNSVTEDLMTRRQVASLFRVTSSAVATWTRRGRLAEVRDGAGRPRYWRTEVEALFRSDHGRAKR